MWMLGKSKSLACLRASRIASASAISAEPTYVLFEEPRQRTAPSSFSMIHPIPPVFEDSCQAPSIQQEKECWLLLFPGDPFSAPFSFPSWRPPKLELQRLPLRWYIPPEKLFLQTQAYFLLSRNSTRARELVEMRQFQAGGELLDCLCTIY